MLNHPTIDRLRDLGLVGMIHALEEQKRQPDSVQLSFSRIVWRCWSIAKFWSATTSG